jgi:hypothetical protein
VVAKDEVDRPLQRVGQKLKIPGRQIATPEDKPHIGHPGAQTRAVNARVDLV